jgi:peroxiredoxin
MDADLAGSLRGAPLPPLTLDSTAGPADLAELARDLLVLFIYPHATGLPDAPVPGWDAVPGARGCTAESCAFRDAHHRFTDVGATVAGLSVQEVDDQRTFAARIGLRYRLISDPTRRLAVALGLPTFTLSGRTFYKRLTLIAARDRIVKVFYPIVEPQSHALAVLEWLEGTADDR